MNRFWVITDADGEPLVDPVARLFVFADKGADDENFYHAQSLMLLNKHGMDAHLNEVALADRDKLSALVEAVRDIMPTLEMDVACVGCSWCDGDREHDDTCEYKRLYDALAAFEGRDAE